MHHFIFPTSDAWISSGSSHIDGTSYKDANFGQDEILELKKEFFNQTFDYPTRVFINFAGTDFTTLSASVADGTISSPRYYLRLYEAEGNQELSTEYNLTTNPLSQRWDEGVGKFDDRPKVTNGVSWENRFNKPSAAALTWNLPGGSYYSGSGDEASQSFSYQKVDVEMDVTSIVTNWLDGTNSNYGFLVKFSGSQETDSEIFGQLKFFSSNTNTIYSPKLEVRWDDKSFSTGSLTELTMSGLADNYLYSKGLRNSYKENDKVKFRVGARKRYIQKTFNTSVQTVSSSFITEDSGSYSIIDVATGEEVVPFSDYTKLSCDSTSNYFIQWLNGFYPDRVYKILYKLKYDDGQEQIFDENFEFKVKR